MRHLIALNHDFPNDVDTKDEEHPKLGLLIRHALLQLVVFAEPDPDSQGRNRAEHALRVVEIHHNKPGHEWSENKTCNQLLLVRPLRLEDGSKQKRSLQLFLMRP